MNFYYTFPVLYYTTACCVGLVAGATDIPALKAVRAAAPSMWILCPGVGAQGGDAQTVCSVGLRKSDGYGLLVSGKSIYTIQIKYNKLH